MSVTLNCGYYFVYPCIRLKGITMGFILCIFSVRHG